MDSMTAIETQIMENYSIYSWSYNFMQQQSFVHLYRMVSNLNDIIPYSFITICYIRKDE